MFSLFAPSVLDRSAEGMGVWLTTTTKRTNAKFQGRLFGKYICESHIFLSLSGAIFLPLLFTHAFPMLVLCICKIKENKNNKSKQTQGYLCFKDLIDSSSYPVQVNPSTQTWKVVKCS